jgi:hypothetical protein
MNVRSQEGWDSYLDLEELGDWPSFNPLREESLGDPMRIYLDDVRNAVTDALRHSDVCQNMRDKIVADTLLNLLTVADRQELDILKRRQEGRRADLLGTMTIDNRLDSLLNGRSI